MSLNLDVTEGTEEQLVDLMVRYPVINRHCRDAVGREVVPAFQGRAEILPNPISATFTKEDGEVVVGIDISRKGRIPRLPGQRWLISSPG